MEQLPVEIIGIILSCLDDARDVIRASVTCRKYRDAFCKHVYSLSFDTSKWLYSGKCFSRSSQFFVTRTISQTKGIRELAIKMDNEVFGRCAGDIVRTWFGHTKESLRKLHYDVRATHHFYILDICRMVNLEWLTLVRNRITRVVPNHHKFTHLHYLSLSQVGISTLDLNLLLAACPKIETFNLIKPKFTMWYDGEVIVLLNIPSLKKIYVEGITNKKFRLITDSPEHLHLKRCYSNVSGVTIAKRTLKYLTLDSVDGINIGESGENLEKVYLCRSYYKWSEFYSMVSGSSNLRALRLCAVDFSKECKVIDLCLPELRSLSLSYIPICCYRLQPSFLERVVFLEVACQRFYRHFNGWLAELLESCPILKKLTIRGAVPNVVNEGCRQELAFFTYCTVELMRKYEHLEFHFDLCKSIFQ